MMPNVAKLDESGKYEVQGPIDGRDKLSA